MKVREAAQEQAEKSETQFGFFANMEFSGNIYGQDITLGTAENKVLFDKIKNAWSYGIVIQQVLSEYTDLGNIISVYVAGKDNIFLSDENTKDPVEGSVIIMQDGINFRLYPFAGSQGENRY